MKGRLKDKIKIGVIIGMSLVAVVLIVSILSGRLSTEEIVVVKDGEIDINETLDEQLEKFQTVEISKTEKKSFGESLVTDVSQLSGKKIDTELEKGSPIPLSMLRKPSSGGQFAQSLEEGHTAHLLPQAASGMPPVKKGDEINVGLIYDDEDQTGEETKSASILFYNLDVINVVGTNIYVDVTIDQSMQLKTAKDIGDFFYQLPGQKELPYCSDLDEEDEDTECLPDNYLPGTVTEEEILSKLEDGEAINEDKVIEDIKEEQEKTKSNKNTSDSNESSDDQSQSDDGEVSIDKERLEAVKENLSDQYPDSYTTQEEMFKTNKKDLKKLNRLWNDLSESEQSDLSNINDRLLEEYYESPSTHYELLKQEVNSYKESES